MADAASTRGQRNYFLVLGWQIACSFTAAACLGASGTARWAPVATGLRQLSAGLLLCSVLLLLVGRVRRFDTVWWDARAVAESIKSAAWRFGMRAQPFEARDLQAGEDFLRLVAAAKRARPAIAASLELQRTEGTAEITQWMKETRLSTLADRSEAYLRGRLDDQQRWYGRRSRQHDRAREAHFWVALVLQAAAMLAAFNDVRPSGLNIGSLLITLAASLTAWAQAKRHEESAQAYALARQELDLMASMLRLALPDEPTFSSLVADTEEAISREHTMWMARRNR